MHLEFSLSDGSVGENVTVFEVDMSSSVHTDNKKDIFNLGKSPTQELDNTVLTAEAKYLINFSRSNRKFFKAWIKMGVFLMLHKNISI